MKISVIGAGLSGLSCARELNVAGYEVVVFEKSRSFGGRCATRKWGRHVVDHGAQYFTVSSGRFRDQLDAVLDQSALMKLEGPVVDADSGVPVPAKRGERYYYSPGNNRMGAALAEGLDVRRERTIERISPEGTGWTVGGEYWDRVVVSCPWPQAAPLLGREGDAVGYVPCLTGCFEYAGPVGGPALARYAVMASGEADPLAWSACENWKVGRVGQGRSVYVVQASEAFSREWLEAGPDEWISKVRPLLEERWHLAGRELLETFAHRWRFARRADSAPKRLAGAFPGLPGIYLAGDATAPSRIESAWLSGLDAAAAVMASS